MKDLIKQIFPFSGHFFRVWSKYLPHHPNLEYLQPLFVRQSGRPSFTPICNIRTNYSSLIERSSEKKSFKNVICRQKLVYKNQAVKIVIQLSDCFLYLIHKHS